MDREAFLDELNKLGYPLVKIEKPVDPNKILAEVVKSQEPRLWQGFPIVFANSIREGNFSCQETLLNISRAEDKKNLAVLMNVSLALYKHLELDLYNLDALCKTDFFDPTLHKELLEDFEQEKDIHVLGNLLSTGSLIKTFKRYFVPGDIRINTSERIKVKEFIHMKEEFDLEFALSQLFSKKQKELLFKKLRGERMTKTEREYYSRAVKKKILAVANPDLHRIAINMLKD